MDIKKGSTDVSIEIRILDETTGLPKTDVVYNSSGLDLWYRRQGAAVTAITEASLSALTDAHADGGFLHIDDGYCRLDLPDAACASGANSVLIGGAVTGGVIVGTRLQLVDYDPNNSNLGLSNVSANVTQFGGTNGTFSGGRPEVNTTHIEGSDATNQIRDAVVDDATRIDASALNTLSSHDPGETIMGATDLGTGSGFTAIPWNAAWDAEVQSECTDALNAYDPPTNAEMEARTLVAADYATATNLATVDSVVDGIKLTTDKLDDTLEDDGGTYRFTANALETAPTGSGGATLSGTVRRGPHLGDVAEDATVRIAFNTVGQDGLPITLGGTPAISIYKASSTTESTTGVMLTVDFDSRTGLHLVAIDTSADAFYATGQDYLAVITTGTVDGDSVVGQIVGSFSIENRFAEVDVTKLGGVAQSATDLKDFADDGYDPATNKVQGVVLVDTVTTLTGHTAQTGDAYAIVNSGTHGNAALKTLIDGVDSDVAALNDLDAAAVQQAAEDALTAFDAATATAVSGVAGQISGLNDLSAADVNAEVVDALSTDTYAEPTGVPAATTSLASKLGYLFMALRNRVDMTATKKTFYDDAGNAEWEKDCSDDGTTYSESEANAI